MDNQFVYTPPKDGKPLKIKKYTKKQLKAIKDHRAKEKVLIDEAIKNCSDCNDESYAQKYMHYWYRDGNSPEWSCARHVNTSREWICITSPKWIANLQCGLNVPKK